MGFVWECARFYFGWLDRRAKIFSRTTYSTEIKFPHLIGHFSFRFFNSTSHSISESLLVGCSTQHVLILNFRSFSRSRHLNYVLHQFLFSPLLLVVLFSFLDISLAQRNKWGTSPAVTLYSNSFIQINCRIWVKIKFRFHSCTHIALEYD